MTSFTLRPLIQMRKGNLVWERTDRKETKDEQQRWTQFTLKRRDKDTIHTEEEDTRT